MSGDVETAGGGRQIELPLGLQVALGVHPARAPSELLRKLDSPKVSPRWRGGVVRNCPNAPENLPWKSVRVVQQPETSFEADVAATRRVLDKAGPCVLVGHSYGGMIITEVGMHSDVEALVYVAAFQPDVGESVDTLSAKMPAASRSVGPVGDGFIAINSDAFASDFAVGVPESVARFMAISQVPIAAEAFGGKTTVAAWKEKPSYAVIATQDRVVAQSWWESEVALSPA